MAPRRTFWANLGVEGVAASTPYVLVDLSDTTNFRHDRSSEIWLLALDINAEKATTGIFDVWVGVVVENDATNGTAKWVHVWHLEANGNPTDATDRFAQSVPFTWAGPEGLDLSVDTDNDQLRYFVGNQEQAGHTNWQNDTNRVSPVGSTTNPGVGDLVVWVEEVTNGGTIDFSITATYKTP